MVPFALRRFIADDAAGSFGVEGIFNVNGYVLLTNGVNGGRIYHLGSEVAKFHRLGIGQVVDGIGRGNDARVGREETVDVGPDFQTFGTECSGHNSSRVVRATTSEIGGHAGLQVGGNETAHHCQTLQPTEMSCEQAVRCAEVHKVFIILRHGLHQTACIDVLRLCQHGGHDNRRQAFAVGHDGIGGFGGKVLNEANAVKNAPQFIEQGIHLCQRVSLAFGAHHGLDQFVMPFGQFAVNGFIRFVALGCRTGKGFQAIGHAAQGRHHHHSRLVNGFDNIFYLCQTLGCSHRSSAKFKYFHCI